MDTLTADSIDELAAGRELDALVAEHVEGWTWDPWKGGNRIERVLMAPKPTTVMLFVGAYVLAGELVITDNLPHYSTDIAAAWQVVEAMHGRGLRYAIKGYFEGVASHGCIFDDENWVDSNPLYKAVAETVPLAICRAALKAVLAHAPDARPG